jgi:endonuclease YncB( thermonuclease family)
LPLTYNPKLPINPIEALIKTKDTLLKNCQFDSVIKIIDGDTIQFEKLGSVRLVGIDADETT